MHSNDRPVKVVDVRNVSFSYLNKIKAIDDVTFSVRQGEKIAFVGPNGAGKSTLITLLNGVLFPEGRIEICGEVLAKKSLKSIRSKIGIVFQNPDDQLFSPTVFEDVAFGPMNFGCSEGEITLRVEKSLREVGLSGFEKRNSMQMSFGEKKLVSIATVLSTDPEIIALDEPTSNLDPYHRRKIIDWIRETNRTVLIATHDLDMLAETVSRIMVIRDGKLKSEGAAMEILKNKKLLEENCLELPLGLQGFPSQPNDKRN